MRPRTTPPLGITNPPIDELLERASSKYALVIYAAKRARQINDYYNQLGDGILEYVGPSWSPASRRSRCPSPCVRSTRTCSSTPKANRPPVPAPTGPDAEVRVFDDRIAWPPPHPCGCGRRHRRIQGVFGHPALHRSRRRRACRPTRAALNFVGAATFEALSGNPVRTDVFEDVDQVAHVKLGQEADLVIIAPADRRPDGPCGGRSRR